MNKPRTPPGVSTVRSFAPAQPRAPRPPSHVSVRLHPTWDAEAYLPALWATNPSVHEILAQSRDREGAREQLFGYLEARERRLLAKGHTGPRLPRILAAQAIRVLKNVIGPLNEERAGVSAVATLVELARGQAAETVSPGFVLEFVHLLRAVAGQPDLYGRGLFDGDDVTVFLQSSGRTAATARTMILDRWAQLMSGTMTRYRSGLDPEVRETRARNRARIRAYFGCTRDEWNSYSWQIRHVIRDADTLDHLVALTRDERDAVARAHANGIPFGITPYYVSLMDPAPSEYDYAIRAQVLPPHDYVACMSEHQGERAVSFDFMGEHDTSPVDLVTRRYPEVAILKPFNTCAQICVYCQRNWEIDDVLAPGAMAAWERIDNALAWLDDHRAVREVLITGGDPCLMTDPVIFRLLEKLSQKPHLTRIRIGTRTPVVLPMRWTDQLVAILSQFQEPGIREVAVVTHFEHSYEIAPESMEAVQRIRRAGMSVYNQEVFTIENSRRFETAKLRKDLRLIGVDPYYTFSMKGKSELRRYRVPIARLLQERREEARLAPGLDRTDEPVFNIPRLGKSHLRAGHDHRIIMIRPDGARMYELDPWEKGLAPVPTYLFVDVPIYDYLLQLSDRGEDPEDYTSIWYYY